MPSRYRIHPAIGTARMGNSKEFFIGPEIPGVPVNWDEALGKFKSFRDASGLVLRQGAQFRVFEYAGDAAPREVTVGGGIVDIEWRVHLANRKSSFYVFNGISGSEDNYVTRSKIAASKKIPGSDPARTNLRNASIASKVRNVKARAEKRAELLDIDPGEKTISQKQPGPVELANPNKHIPIGSLGTLRLGEKGRLIVLGGYGESNSTEKPPREIDEYASNDTWFDDAGDGSVKARIRFSDGTVIDADPAWVLVGPPKFAPGIGTTVSLYDTFWDVGVREVDIPASAPKTLAMRRLIEQKKIWKANRGKSLAGFKPSFLNDIYPLLKHALGARDVHTSGTLTENYHLTALPQFSTLSNPGPEGGDLRDYVFNYLRDPDGKTVEWKKMPRGLGDDYTPLGNDSRKATPRSFLSLTRIQYAMMREWAAGNFVNDWPGAEPPVPAVTSPTPDGLDRAAAENCIGSPFFPGIEVSWLIRVAELYAEPFRLKIPREPEGAKPPKPLKIGAVEFRTGFFTQQMALPWQADFFDCHKEQHDDPDGNAYTFMWWTAQRPDDVFPSGEKTQVSWVRKFDIKDEDNDDDRFKKMQEGWFKLRFVSVKNASGRYEEEPEGPGK